jgi:PST family polysaccharide transporter
MKNDVDIADLKRRSARGGVVTVVSQGFTVASQLISTVILARLLTPQDYGVIAMVLAVTSFAGVFRDLGLSSAAIQKRNLTVQQQTNLFWLNVGMGLVLTVSVAAASPLVAWFYGKPELLWVTVILSLNFLIGSFAAQHGAMLVRNMQFERQAVSNVGGAIAGLALSIALALWGWSYWALVWGNIAATGVTSLLLLVLSPFRPGWIRKNAGTHSMVRFGVNVAGFNLVNYLHRNLDNVLIGKFEGAATLGIYSRAYSLLMMPINAVRNPINAVAFPALSRLQSQPEEFRAYCRAITQVIAFISMPMVAFLGVASNDVIAVALGPQWSESARIFVLLSVAAFVQPVGGIRGQVMLSLGRSSRYLRWGVFNAVLTSLAFCIGIFWGAEGVAAAFAVATLLILYPSVVYSFADSPLSPLDFFGPIARPAFASIGAAAIVWAASLNGSFCNSQLLNLLVKCALFGLCFTALNCSTHKGRQDILLLISTIGAQINKSSL